MRENMCYPPGDINIPNTLDFYFQVGLFVCLPRPRLFVVLSVADDDLRNDKNALFRFVTSNFSSLSALNTVRRRRRRLQLGRIPL